jgi:hypothetical protein
VFIAVQSTWNLDASTVRLTEQDLRQLGPPTESTTDYWSEHGTLAWY